VRSKVKADTHRAESSKSNRCSWLTSMRRLAGLSRTYENCDRNGISSLLSAIGSLAGRRRCLNRRLVSFRRLGLFKAGWPCNVKVVHFRPNDRLRLKSRVDIVFMSINELLCDPWDMRRCLA
jgi:hypothetical protein